MRKDRKFRSSRIQKLSIIITKVTFENENKSASNSSFENFDARLRLFDLRKCRQKWHERNQRKI